MDPITIAKLWLTIKPIKRLKERRQAKKQREREAVAKAGGEFFEEKETPMLNGKLTYAAQAGMAIVFVGQLIGVDITQEAAASIVGVVLALVGVYGRFRATRAK